MDFNITNIVGGNNSLGLANMGNGSNVLNLTNIGTAGNCCTQLSESLGSSVIMNSTSAFANSQASYWAIQESELIPSCIAMPSVTSELSTAISIISSFESCPFAIKSGGHGTVLGSANIDGGVKIDLSLFDKVETNTEGTVTTVGAGAQWGAVYEYLDARGLSVAGGRNGGVGVGGLLLGGGISFYGPRVGWACDNILNAEVVLASGEVVNANASSNPDLLKAIKGGSNNFGVVTSFDLLTFPQDGMWTGALGQPIDVRKVVFNAIAEIASNSNADPFGALVADFRFNSATGAWVMNHTIAYTKPVANPLIFQLLVSIKPQLSNTISIKNMSSVASGQQIGAKQAYNKNHLSYTGTYSSDAALLSKIFDISNATVYKILSQINGAIKWNLMMEPVPALMNSFGDKSGGNSLGTSAGNGDSIVVLQLAQFDDSAAGELVEMELRSMFDEIAREASAMGFLHQFQYLNYAGKQQHPISSYGPQSVTEMQATSRKYDPKGLFQLQVLGGFKLGLE